MLAIKQLCPIKDYLTYLHSIIFILETVEKMMPKRFAFALNTKYYGDLLTKYIAFIGQIILYVVTVILLLFFCHVIFPYFF